MYVRTYHARRSIMRHWRNILVSFCQNYHYLLAPAFLCSVNDSFSRNQTSLKLTIYNQDTIRSLQFSCHTVNYPPHTEWRPEKLPMTGREAISHALIPTAYNL